MKSDAILNNFAGMLLVASSTGVGADPGADLFKAKICDTCHGEDGTHPVTEDIPVIAGQTLKYLVRQMQDIRDGQRTNGLSESMRAAMTSIGNDELEAIADWLASRW